MTAAHQKAESEDAAPRGAAIVRNHDNAQQAPHSWRALLVPIFTAVAFGLYPAAAQRAYADGANAQLVMLVTTFARAFALIIAAAYLGQTLIPRQSEWRWAISGGFFQALSVAGVLASLVYLPGPVMITLVFTHTIMLLLFLAARGEMQLTKAALLTTLAALVGVSLVVNVWSDLAHIAWRGVILALIAAVASMSRLYVFGKQVEEFNPALVGARVFTATFLFLALSLLFVRPEAPHSSVGWLGIAGACLSLVLGSFGTFYGIALVGSFQFSLMIKLEPIFTALFSLLLLNQVLRAQQYFGMLLVVASLITYQWRRRN